MPAYFPPIIMSENPLPLKDEAINQVAQAIIASGTDLKTLTSAKIRETLARQICGAERKVVAQDLRAVPEALIEKVRFHPAIVALLQGSVNARLAKTVKLPPNKDVTKQETPNQDPRQAPTLKML